MHGKCGTRARKNSTVIPRSVPKNLHQKVRPKPEDAVHVVTGDIRTARIHANREGEVYRR